MASRDLATLHPKMQELVKAWESKTPVEILIYCTVREAWEQAVLYAQGRTAEQIASGVARLGGLGLAKEAMLLEKQSPKEGKRVTNALPGLSFHQPHHLDGEWGGLAVDFVPIVGGKPLWNDVERYRLAAEAAESVGLSWAGRWTTFKETAHCQYDRGGEIKILPLVQGAYRE